LSLEKTLQELHEYMDLAKKNIKKIYSPIKVAYFPQTIESGPNDGSAPLPVITPLKKVTLDPLKQNFDLEFLF